MGRLDKRSGSSGLSRSGKPDADKRMNDNDDKRRRDGEKVNSNDHGCLKLSPDLGAAFHRSSLFA
jgi:hypothetical protein